ncbi:MAG: S-layer homology domain-containing protein [Oscillospiraceae bacterium]
MQETYPENKEITFAWNNTDRTTHYNLWLDKLNENNEWETVEQIFYAKSGLTRELQPGHYRAQLLSYNSDLYEPDGSDWYHTWSNDCYFAVTHNYVVSEDIPASCTEYARTTYTCTLCGDHYTEYKDASYSDWSTTKPAGVDEELIESRTEYRYSDYETKTSDASELSGWTKTGSDWEKTGSGTIDYVDSWPSGFSTNSALYRQYNNTPKSASETSTAKTTVSASNGGYLYYHWCRGNYTGGPINRKTSPNYTSEFGSFHAFYSDTAPGSLGSASDDGSYVYANASCCTDSHWYYPVAVTRQSYTTYKKVFTYSRWTAWSDWSAQARTSSDTRKVETRTAYRYLQVQMGEHKWDDGVISVPATCAAEGTKTYTCTVCKATKTEPIAKQAHDYRQTVVAATCTAKGYTLNKCSRCGDEYRDAETEMLPHAYVNGVCTVCGNKVFLIRPTAVTAVAGATVTVPVEIWNNAGFAGFTFQITSDPSLVLTGIKRGAVLEAAGNGLFTVNIKKGIINWTGDCNITGNGVILELTFTIADNVSDGEYEVSVACKGNEASNCVDEHSQPVAVTFEPGTVTVTKAPHVHSYKAVVTAPTCTSKGYTTHTCACGDSYVDTYVDALGHSWDSGKVTKEPTETEDGVKTYTCTRCGETKTETIPKLTHEHNYNAVVTAPTCTEKGYTTHTCACGDSYVDTYVDALGHAWDNGKVTKEPTETKTGVKTFTCTRCGETKTETIPVTNCPSAVFTDVQGGDHWAHEGIDYCIANGLMSGIGNDLFGPKLTTTRAQIVQILYNLEGEPKVSGTTPFTDLTNDWYKDAVLWAYQTGVVAGTSSTTFEPDLPVTREQIAVILMEYMTRVLKLERTWTPADLSIFPDADSVSDWAKDAMADAVGLGLISGASNGGQTYLEPQGSATREQVATILMEFCKNVKK